tara:strand:+ start:1935 stop:3194 length:1260 start_codon:yes stop_codon:yes gene_type:complete
MKLSAKTIEKLVGIIIGDSQVSPYRSGPQLIAFFRDFGERDLYGQGFPSRAAYTKEKLEKFDGMDVMRSIISNAFDFFDADGSDPEVAAEDFNRALVRDGYRLTLEYRRGWMEGDRHVEADPYFAVVPISALTVAPTALAAVNHEAVREQIQKANRKIDSGDYAGAIASAYTLVEQLLKLLLVKTSTTYKENDGDIRSLYKALRAPLRLDPSDESIDAPLRPILDGFQKLIAGLYEISNKASDRHARIYNPAAHHAKLAVNSAFALCEFLVESHAYQAGRLEADAQGGLRMTEWVVDVDDTLAEALAECIRQGPIREIKDGKAMRMLTEETVARIEGLKIEIFANEHPPPHFRVIYQGSTANFTIADCKRMNGSGQILRFEKNVVHWWSTNKKTLIETWNRLRPADCPVGKYKGGQRDR